MLFYLQTKGDKMQTTDINIRAPLNELLLSYQREVERLKEFSQMIFSENYKRIVGLYESANSHQHQHSYRRSILELKIEDAIKELDVEYWGNMFKVFGFNDLLAANERGKWKDLIYNRKVPEFSPSNVIATAEEYYYKSQELFNAKVDCVFQSLSRNHVTNQPEGFWKRMIFSWSRGSNSYGSTNDIFVDFIWCCNTILGRENISNELYQIAHYIERSLPKTGKWFWVAGNLFKIRAYLNGNFHIEIHPDMVWRLNEKLAEYSGNTKAIPAKFRRKPTRSYDAPKLFNHYFQPSTLTELSLAKQLDGCILFDSSCLPNKELCSLLESIGGVCKSKHEYTFDYDYQPIIDSILENGCVPDNVAYQIYPTPPLLAERLVKEANIKPHHQLLEPSAGLGNLVKLASEKTNNITAVEISEFRHSILKQFVDDAHCADFMVWENPYGFDRIVMNPPFTKGQAAAHIQRASRMLNKGGILVSIVPSGFAHDIGCQYSLSEPISNQFKHTSIEVRILKIEN